VPKAPVDIVSFAINFSYNLLHAPIMNRFLRIIEIGNQDRIVWSIKNSGLIPIFEMIHKPWKRLK
jgi:hypothetical protein